MSRPSFDELVGAGELAAQERERLRRAHDALVAAGPPPEPPRRLAPPPPAALAGVRRRPGLLAALAAALAVASFGAGWVARGGEEFEVVRVVEMNATGEAPGATATLHIGPRDEHGNWPMIVEAEGLEPLPEGGYYVLLLTRDGEPIANCGTFNVAPDGSARVRLGASYRLDRFEGWVVRPYVHGEDELNETVVLTT